MEQPTERGRASASASASAPTVVRRDTVSEDSLHRWYPIDMFGPDDRAGKGEGRWMDVEVDLEVEVQLVPMFLVKLSSVGGLPCS
jgi:hypothetical protein